MIREFLVKEWKERIGLIVFSLALLAGTAFLAFAVRADKNLQEMVSIAYGLIVLPIIALLIGTSAFSGEIRNDAWSYLLSRPLKKGKIWLLKLLSMAVILIAILTVHALLSRIFPFIETILSSYHPADFLGYSFNLWTGSWVAALILFIVGFSLSAFSSSSPMAVFIGLLMAVGVVALGGVYYLFLLRIYPHMSGLSGIVRLLPLSLLAAAGWTFAESDPSLPIRNILRFAKNGSIFLVLALLASTGLTWVGGGFYGDNDYVSNLQEYEGNVYFSTPKGVYVYRSSTDRLKKMGKFNHYYSDVVLGGGRMALLNSRRGGSQELWIMNPDGTERRRLASERGENQSLFEHDYFYSCSISRNGRVIVLPSFRSRKGIALNWLNTDGSGLQRRVLDFLPKSADGQSGNIFWFGWSDDSRSIFFIHNHPGSSKIPKRLWSFNLETQTAKSLTEGTSPRALSPDGRRIVIARKSEANIPDKIALLDLTSSMMEDVPLPKEGRLLRLEWSPSGDRLAAIFASAGSLQVGIYSLAEKRWTSNRVLGPAEPEKDIEVWRIILDWFPRTGGKTSLLYGNGHDDGKKLLILDETLVEEKTIPLPDLFQSVSFSGFGAGDKVLLNSYARGELWRYDLLLGDWKKLY